MDNDSRILQEMGNTIIEFQVKYRQSSLADRMAMKPLLEELLHDYAKYQIRLLKEGVITTDEDLDEMAQIKDEIDKAAEKQELIKAIARTVAFIAAKI